MSDVIDKIKNEANHIEWDATYSSKGHFNAAMIWNAVHYVLGISAIVLGGFSGKEFWGSDPAFGAIFAVSAAAITSVITFLKPSDKAKPHHESGVLYSEIKRKSRMFKEISTSILTDHETLLRELKQLQHEYSEIQKAALPISALAYSITRTGIRRGEHLYDEADEL